MAQEHDAALYLGPGGLRLDVWDRYTVSLSMLDAALPFAFSLWKSQDRQSAWVALKEWVKVGKPVVLQIDGATLLNGYVGQAKCATTRQGSTIVVSGRDLAGPAMTWDADPRLRLKGLSLDAALERLFAPLGIPVWSDADATAARQVQMGTSRAPRLPSTSTASSSRRRTRRRAAIDYAHPRPGEKIWQVATALCQRLGYMLWVAPHPEHGLAVVVDTPDYASPVQYQLRRVYDRQGNVTADSNILESELTVSIEQVPTEVHVYTGSARGEAVSARSMQTVFNTALEDADISGGWTVPAALHQPRHVRAERARTPGGAQRTGERILADAMRGFRTYECTVQGHGQDGRLYAINTMAHVRDDEWDVDEDMLILRATFERSREGSKGTTTRLTLGPKGAIVLTPEEE